MKPIFCRAVLALSVLPIAAPALAGQSPWQDFEGARMRLVTADAPETDGTLRAALEIGLKPGWKTYWREPGDAGIPPVIKLVTASGSEPAEIGYPLPRRFKDAYSTWAGYDAPVSLALTFAPPEGGFPDPLEISAFLGVCKDICIPLQADFVAEADDGSGEQAVGGAFAALPADADNRTGLITQAKRDGDRILLEGPVPAYHAIVQWYVAGSEGWSFGDPETLSSGGGKTVVALPVLSSPKDGKGTLHYTFSGPPGGVAGSVPVTSD
ncbi:MAG: hypothetical protein KDJ74_00315 [Notoacmeibacter sp.]|nr:hypothetical protein [Notoacmeibacter sp.]